MIDLSYIIYNLDGLSVSQCSVQLFGRLVLSTKDLALILFFIWPVFRSTVPHLGTSYTQFVSSRASSTELFQLLRVASATARRFSLHLECRRMLVESILSGAL